MKRGDVMWLLLNAVISFALGYMLAGCGGRIAVPHTPRGCTARETLDVQTAVATRETWCGTDYSRVTFDAMETRQ